MSANGKTEANPIVSIDACLLCHGSVLKGPRGFICKHCSSVMTLRGLEVWAKQMEGVRVVRD
jgi:hypothetical protein